MVRKNIICFYPGIKNTWSKQPVLKFIVSERVPQGDTPRTVRSSTPHTHSNSISGEVTGGLRKHRNNPSIVT